MTLPLLYSYQSLEATVSQGDLGRIIAEGDIEAYYNEYILFLFDGFDSDSLVSDENTLRTRSVGL